MKYDGWLLPVLLLAMLPARAQQDSVRVAETLVADSVATMAPDSLAAEGVVDSTMLEGKFNALRYSMQKRYRPKDEPFVSGSFWDNTFVFAGGGVEKLVPREPLSFGLGPVFRLGAGKWWRPYHGVRVALAGEFFVRDHDSEKVSNFGVDVEHLFNLNAYLGGYKPGRFLEVWTVEGLGYRYSSLAGEGKHVVDLHVGLNLNMRIGERVDFFVEPRVTFYSDAVDHSADVNWHRYDVGYGGVGIPFSAFRGCESGAGGCSGCVFPVSGCGAAVPVFGLGARYGDRQFAGDACGGGVGQVVHAAFRDAGVLFHVFGQVAAVSGWQQGQDPLPWLALGGNVGLVCLGEGTAGKFFLAFDVRSGNRFNKQGRT